MSDYDPFAHIPDAPRRDWDAIAAANATGAGKGRRKQPNHKPRTAKIFAEMGERFEARETTKWISQYGVAAPMKCDYLGLFDGVLLNDQGHEKDGVQICSLEGVTAHIRKMCSTKRSLAGIRQKNLVKWLESGKRAIIIYFFQDSDKGKGSRWLHGFREVTMADVQRVNAGLRIYMDVSKYGKD